jgi:hypothetical protein
MITYTAFDITVTPFIRALTGMKHQLQKSEEFCTARKADSAKLLQDRVVFDQFPLVKQIQIATDIAKRIGGFLAGMEVPAYQDTETTFADVYARIDKTIEYLKSIPAEKMTMAPETVIPMSWMPTKGLPAKDMALIYSVPNFYFHCTLAYEIMRKNGVELGKGDYLWQLPLVDVTQA